MFIFCRSTALLSDQKSPPLLVGIGRDLYSTLRSDIHNRAVTKMPLFVIARKNIYVFSRKDGGCEATYIVRFVFLTMRPFREVISERMFDEELKNGCNTGNFTKLKNTFSCQLYLSVI